MRRWYFIGMLSSFALGCFSDPNPTGAGCPDGASGCSCYGNGTCDADLVCNADSNCVDEDCQDGSAECPCYGNGTCDAGLTCDANICRRSTGGSGTSVSGSGSATSTTSPPMTTGSTSVADTSASGTVTDPTSPGPGSDPTLPSETGLIECAGCSAGQACSEGGCIPTPYIGCDPTDDCNGGTCLEGSNSNVCAPECNAPSHCPVAVDGLFPLCESNNCILPCVTNGDCPGSAPFCDHGSPLGVAHCVAEP